MRNSLLAIGGALIGAGITYLLLTKKYEGVLEDISNELRRVVDEHDHNEAKEIVDEDDKNKNPLEMEQEKKSKIAKPSYAQDYEAEVTRTGYNKMSEETPKRTRKKKNPDIEYINPIDYGTDDNFDQIELTYYADGVVADDDNMEMTADEIAHAIGSDFASHFGEFEDDCVYVRNNKRSAFYAVVMDERDSDAVI